MGLLDTIKGVSKSVSGSVKGAMKKRTVKKAKAAKTLRDKRAKSLPLINHIAKEYGATVEPMDKAAYVSKTVKGREKGVHISYGSDPDVIRMKLDKAFYSSSVASQIIKTGKAIKQTRDDLKKAGWGKSSMYGDPKDMFKL